MPESKSGIADEKTKGTRHITVTDGKVTAIDVVDQPMYWYDGAWHPYPKGDKISIVEK